LYRTLEPDNDKSHTTTYPWDEFKTDEPEMVYLTSMVASLIALLLNICLSLGIFFCMMVGSTRKIGFRLTFGLGIKWFCLLLGLIATFFVCLAWTLFFRFNRALSDANDPSFATCPPETYVDPHSLFWCSSFYGSKTTGVYDTRYAWGPSAGWAFSVIACGFGLIGAALLLISPRNPDPDYEEIGREGYFKIRKSKRETSMDSD